MVPHGPHGKTEAVRVDSHHHVWDESVRDAPWAEPFPVLHRAFTLDDLGPIFVENAIDAGILVQTRLSSEETRAFLNLAATRRTVLGVVGSADLLASVGRDRVMCGSEWPVCWYPR